ncbi:PROCA1 isoform 6 [Pan troglodytes]|uniref:Protein interacting with cyclin A1 n=2 Tax=Homininae TaxID=207598 RepID=J3QQU2_HUMAN|nr:protein interacting with cyclin A1 [Homo sapiens]KAI4048556.1 protein interacting with cyclin A1 [Homo sapiens]PNI46958.1 PROCA1 isoform 6 [Pan troglodytes]
MWVRTTLTIERWTKEKTEPKARSWDESRCRDVNRLPSWERGHLLAGVASSTDVSTFSEGDCKEPDKCCWRHKQCTGHIIYPFASDCVRHSLHLHSVNHCNCNSSFELVLPAQSQLCTPCSALREMGRRSVGLRQAQRKPTVPQASGSGSLGE